MFRRLWTRLKRLWTLAKSERAAPSSIGWAVALGVLAGCTPALGFHGPLALGVATIFRKNRLFCWIGSRVSNFVTLPFVVYAQVQVAHRLRTGQWADIDRSRILDQALEFLADWCLGIIPVGGLLAAIFGTLAYGWARRRDRLRAEKEPPAPSEITAPASVE